MHNSDSKHQSDEEARKRALEERVRKMMDPAAESEKATAPEITTDLAEGAPALNGVPIPKEPLTMKIITGDADKASEAVMPTTKTTELDEAEDDPDTVKAVDDIVANESDELLRVEDEKRQAGTPKEDGREGKLKHLLKNWWRNPKARWATIGCMVAVLGLIGGLPVTRYLLLNAAGVRASASVMVLDRSTMLPLRGVTVSAHGISAETDETGTAELKKIKLGATELHIHKRAFAEVTRSVTLGWGSNPLDDVRLKPTGTQYAFRVTDYVSGKPIQKAEATSGEASAFSDKQGRILLTIANPSTSLRVIISHEGKRREGVTISGDMTGQRTVRMVPERRHVFISKRSGKFNIYADGVDGRQVRPILRGTGSEREAMRLLSHPKKEVAAFVSTRTGRRNSDGYLLDSLFTLDLDNAQVNTIATAEKIQLVDWVGDRLVYVRIIAGASGSNPKRQRLMSYDFSSQRSTELAASNYFNDVMVADGKVYYAPAAAYQQGVNVSLFEVAADGSDRMIIAQREVNNMFRTTFNHIAFASRNTWYDYRLGDTKSTKLSGQPANPSSRIYVNSPSGQKSLWVDKRDGRGVLIVYDKRSGKDTILHMRSGLINPIRWYDDSTVGFRVKTDTETADYVMSLEGGSPHKITDVTDVPGIVPWYYY